jgi:hypothetical protein
VGRFFGFQRGNGCFILGALAGVLPSRIVLLSQYIIDKFQTSFFSDTLSPAFVYHALRQPWGSISEGLDKEE